MSEATVAVSRSRRKVVPAAAQKRLAVIGCGQWGKHLVRNLAALGALRAVVDPHPAALDAVGRQHPGTALASDPDAVFRDETIDACVIATPAALHYEMARRALAAGKDVFVEKPLALTAADGRALVELAAKRHRVLMVGHLLEYHPAVGKLKELIASGEMGKVCYIYANRLNLGRIRTEENALWSFAPHDIHVMLRLLGERPVEVACRGGNFLNEHIADVTMSEMRFASGVRGHIFVSWLHPYKEHRLVVVGDRKMAVFDDTDPVHKLRLYPHRVDWIGREPVAVKAEAEIVELPNLEPLAQECRHFLECLTTRAAPRTDGQNGVEVLEILEACQRSLERGGIPVPVAEPATASAASGVEAHPTAVIGEGASIGEGTRIWHYSHVMGGSRIGKRCVLGQNVFVGKGAVIGDGVKIQNNVSVYDGVRLEDGVFCGPSMVFTNVLNPRSHVSRKHEFRKTLVRQGATLGANATIVCGHTIGAYAFVGAGAVVTKDVPAYALVLGTPARLAGWMCRCGERLGLPATGGTARAACAACGTSYRRTGPRAIEEAAS